MKDRAFAERSLARVTSNRWLRVLALLGLSLCAFCATSSAKGQELAIRIAPTDLMGNPVVAIEPGDSFLLGMYAKDLRVDAEGIFSVYADLVFDNTLFAPTGQITYSDEYTWARTGAVQSGLIDEAGAIFGGDAGEVSEQLVLSVHMTARPQSGAGLFEPSPADLIESEATLFGRNTAVTANDIHFVGSQLIVSSVPVFDFDADSGLDCSDIHVLATEISRGSSQPAFDLTGDGAVDILDRNAWLAHAGVANLGAGRSFLPGDTQLDGSVDSRDLGMLLNNFGDSSGRSWCEGNFNGDHFVNSADLGLLLNEFGGSAAAGTSVPEPHFAPWWFLLFGGWYIRRRAGV